MKLLSIFFFNFVLLCIPTFAEEIMNKSEILKETNNCFKAPQEQLCRKLITHLDKIQFFAYKSNRFKCQSSILGLQTELVKAYFFENAKTGHKSTMIPYVIKNC